MSKDMYDVNGEKCGPDEEIGPDGKKRKKRVTKAGTALDKFEEALPPIPTTAKT